MTLPSPIFTQTQPKPPTEEKPPHVTEPKLEIQKKTQFVAYCKFCREGFSSENELFQHRRNHERCPYDGCKFNASEKVVSEHVQRVHLQKGNALVKIQDLTTPEQIEKWREERRKRYPTTANVILRQQAKEERMNRGERLNDRQKRFGDFQQRNHLKNSENKRDFNGKRGDNRKRHHNNRDRREKTENSVEKVKVTEEVKAEKIQEQKPAAPHKFLEPKKPKLQVIENEDSSDDEKRATPMFKGTSQMKDYHAVETVVREQAALSILGMYGSDSESEIEEPEKVEEPERVEEAEKLQESMQTVADEENSKLEDNSNEVLNEDDDNEAPEEVPIEHKSSEIPPEPQTTYSERFQRKRRHENQQPPRQRSVLDYAKLRKPSINPFLEKLLQEDIRHERNILLQCVNFIVSKNFFGVGKTETKPNEDKKVVE